MPSLSHVPEPFSNKSGILHLENTDLNEIADKYGTPLYVTSSNRIAENYSRINEAFSSRYKKFSIKYAVKANSNPHIISILASLGSGADVSNLNELIIAERSGVNIENMLMTPNNLGAMELREASKRGVAINFDDIGQMESISNFLPRTVSFRVNPGIGRGEFPGTVTAGPKAKFGIPEEHVGEAYNSAKENGAEKFGIQMMTGSNVLDPEYFGVVTSKLFEIVNEISDQIGITFDFIDIGGGFGIPYRQGESELDIQRVAELVTENLKVKFGDSGKEIPALFIEPGRYLVADSTVLLGTVTNVKSYGKTFVGTDAGMNTLLRPALYGAYHPLTLVKRLDEESSITADVVGQICENTDRIAEERELPNVVPGDRIAVFNAGAYGYAMSNQFNGHGRPAEVLIANGKDRLIRKRETLEDLVRNVV